MADVDTEYPTMHHPNTMADFTDSHQEDVMMNLFTQLAQQMKTLTSEHDQDEGYVDDTEASVDTAHLSPELLSPVEGGNRLKRRKRCGVCGPCRVVENCNVCIYCIKRSTMKQACIQRRCVEIPKINYGHRRKLSWNRKHCKDSDVKQRSYVTFNNMTALSPMKSPELDTGLTCQPDLERVAMGEENLESRAFVENGSRLHADDDEKRIERELGLLASTPRTCSSGVVSPSTLTSVIEALPNETLPNGFRDFYTSSMPFDLSKKKSTRGSLPKLSHTNADRETTRSSVASGKNGFIDDPLLKQFKKKKKKKRRQLYQNGFLRLPDALSFSGIKPQFRFGLDVRTPPPSHLLMADAPSNLSTSLPDSQRRYSLDLKKPHDYPLFPESNLNKRNNSRPPQPITPVSSAAVVTTTTPHAAFPSPEMPPFANNQFRPPWPPYPPPFMSSIPGFNPAFDRFPLPFLPFHATRRPSEPYHNQLFPPFSSDILREQLARRMPLPQLPFPPPNPFLPSTSLPSISNAQLSSAWPPFKTNSSTLLKPSENSPYPTNDFIKNQNSLPCSCSSCMPVYNGNFRHVNGNPPLIMNDNSPRPHAGISPPNINGISPEIMSKNLKRQDNVIFPDSFNGNFQRTSDSHPSDNLYYGVDLTVKRDSNTKLDSFQDNETEPLNVKYPSEGHLTDPNISVETDSNIPIFSAVSDQSNDDSLSMEPDQSTAMDTEPYMVCVDTEPPDTGEMHLDGTVTIKQDVDDISLQIKLPGEYITATHVYLDEEMLSLSRDREELLNFVCNARTELCSLEELVLVH